MRENTIYFFKVLFICLESRVRISGGGRDGGVGGGKEDLPPTCWFTPQPLPAASGVWGNRKPAGSALGQQGSKHPRQPCCPRVHTAGAELDLEAGLPCRQPDRKCGPLLN